MPPTVCCPSCWTWSDASARTTCKSCGSPLVLPDGRRVDEFRNAPPPPPPLPVASGYPPPNATPPPLGYVTAVAGPAPTNPAPPMSGYVTSVTGAGLTGTNWVAICRWITLGYGLLSAIALVGIGLLLRHISVPITDPNTGIITTQTFDIGAAFAFVALIVAAVTALFAWLTQYTTARVIFLLLDALALLSVFSGAGTSVRGGGFGVAEVISVGVDLVYGVALVMSLVSRPQPAYA